MNPTARRNARQYALQAMYQWQISGAPISAIEGEFVVNYIKEKVDLEYFKELIHSIPKMFDELDEQMIPFMSRPVEELDPIELAILRIAIYEFMRRLDVPYKVVINEALELAKRFGSVEGYKFVNGVLDQVARKIRKDELAAKK